MANIKSLDWYGGGLGAAIRPGASLGLRIYLDGTGPDTNDGLSPTTPVASFKQALSLCTNDHNDTIVVLDYWAAGTEDWPIVVDKSMVRIIGVPLGGVAWAQVNPTGDVAGMSITAAGVEICNLSVNGGAAHGCIELAAAGIWGVDIHHCQFGEMGTGQDGIRNVAPFDTPYLRIWACRFGAGLTRNGIRLDHNATRGMLGVPGLESNWFRQVGAEGIRINNQFAQGGIFDNRFCPVSDTQGYAITLDATCAGVHVDGNHANFGDADMGNNPYLDSAAGDTNHWGLNYLGITATMPA